MSDAAREIENARTRAEEALDEYARLAFGWNVPDDKYTRNTLRIMCERAIKANDPSAVSPADEAKP